MTVAVDFDGVITVKDNFPEIHDLNPWIISDLIALKNKGYKLILWTCREGKYLEKAIQICKDNGLEFDAVNDNLEENKLKYKNNCRKVAADYYLDDKNINSAELHYLIFEERN